MIYNGQLGTGWSLRGSVGVALPKAGAPGNFSDLCLDLPGSGSLTFSYSGPNPFINHTSLSFATRKEQVKGAANETAPPQLDITLLNSKFPVVKPHIPYTRHRMP